MTPTTPPSPTPHPPTPPPSTPVAPAASPLAEPQLTLAREVGRQMHTALDSFLCAFPEPQRTAKALAANLRIEGVVARRIVRAAHDTDELRLLTRLPSAPNLRKAHTAATTADIPTAITDQLLAAIQAFESLATTIGGGKAALTKRLRTTLAPKA